MDPASTGPCVVVYSGGTDSTCVAALMAARHETVHLLTYVERATARSPLPEGNIRRLRAHFGDRFVHHVASIDALLVRLSYGRWFRNLFRHGLFLLATPGFSSLSWHLKTIQYCKQHGISVVADGLTRELMHFPGHMDHFVNLMRDLYAANGIRYENPVRDWPTPPDQQFLHRLVVDYHGFTTLTPTVRTTGKYLHDLGIFPHPNVKGSNLDHSMQHDCYPFVVFNLFVFWIYLPFHTLDAYAERLRKLFTDKLSEVSDALAAGTLP